MGTAFYIPILQLLLQQCKTLLFESRPARVFKNFINWPYIDQAIHPQSFTTNLLIFPHHKAHLILNFKISFVIFKF